MCIIGLGKKNVWEIFPLYLAATFFFFWTRGWILQGQQVDSSGLFECDSHCKPFDKNEILGKEKLQNNVRLGGDEIYDPYK